jgi:hypothetical protein
MQLVKTFSCMSCTTKGQATVLFPRPQVRRPPAPGPAAAPAPARPSQQWHRLPSSAAPASDICGPAATPAPARPSHGCSSGAARGRLPSYAAPALALSFISSQLQISFRSKDQLQYQQKCSFLRSPTYSFFNSPNKVSLDSRRFNDSTLLVG